MDKLYLGFAREDMSPDKPVRMNSQCTGVEVWHSIFAHALYFCDSEAKALVINTDLRQLPDHFLEPLRPLVAEKTGVPAENIVFTATHNHSCPDVTAGEVENIVDWKERIGYPAILRAAEAAVADAKPVVSMEGGRASSEKINFVRRYLLEDGTWKSVATANPSTAPRIAHESEADLELRAVRLHREGGKDVVLINYQTHAAGALAKFKDKVNADFCGELRDAVEEATGAWAVYLQGACGNTNYSTLLQEEKPQQRTDYRDVAESLAKTTLEALDNAQPLALGKLQMRSQQYLADVDHRQDHLADRALEIAKMKDAQERSAALREAGLKNHLIQWAIIRRARMAEKQEAELNSIAFGDFAMAFCPQEMFCQLGQQLRELSPYPMTFPCNYAQIYRGYMPSLDAVPHGEYEVDVCQFLPGTGEKEVQILTEQLQDMYGKR